MKQGGKPRQSLRRARYGQLNKETKTDKNHRLNREK